LKAVATFEAAARHQSFKMAAEELNLTPSAISHQVRQLEAQLGVALFRRLRGGLTITDAGAAYLKMLSPAFREIDNATKYVMQMEYADQLTIRSAPSFARKWLLDRIPNFLALHPDIDVKLIATSERLDFRSKNIDIGIYYGSPDWPDHIVHPLLSERVLPMCSPEFKAKARGLVAPADLLRFTLIHTERNLVTWSMWLADRGVGALAKLRGVCLDPSELAIDAAVRGVGIVLESDVLAARELAEGSLVPALEDTATETVSYYLVYPAEHADIPKVSAFVCWITALSDNTTVPISDADHRSLGL
jgi:LysR family glycine cleavage system transcriptional activator